MTKINLSSIGIKLASKAQPEAKAEPEAAPESKEEPQAKEPDPTPAPKPVGLRIKMAVGTTNVSEEPAKDESKVEPESNLTKALKTLSDPNFGKEKSSDLVNITSSAPEDVHIPNFKERLEALDSLFVEGHGYPSLVIDSVRSHIKEVMKELKSSPEMMHLVKADDVRNIMAFVQQSAKDARLGFADKNEKAVKRTKKKQSQVKFDLSGFKDEVAQQVAKETRSLESLSKANVDNVNLKFKG